ncbi:aminotransferase class III-fold pyridoxal phosphate-dependent enzyme [Sphaerisporangium fuscum]|uniref:aminotransferase class III-fold pyridoxal phosphate-dependent enzyme n=1 Tax=Sphaerisporangium fuscum TaxID=2835868 RepID=UPI001BDCCD5E|nr:aminotransferase class III-fold pyridoxal phosphate-dependent enzyme [Sphaerisporangium fuscum]
MRVVGDYRDENDRRATGTGEGERPGVPGSAETAGELERAAELVRALYGLEGELTRLPGERDLNFRLSAAGGERYVVKLHVPGTDPAELDLQNAVLSHLEAQHAPPPAPRVVAAGDGRGAVPVPWSDGERTLRVLTWMHGRPWTEVEPTPGRLRDLGRHVAGVDRAMRDLTHPAMRRELLWNLTSAPRVEPFAAAVDGSLRPLVLQVFDRFRAHVAPRLPSLPHQIIHNDGNEFNILVDDSGGVAGLIDFGDVVWSPRICGLAVAGAYAMQGHHDPVRAVLPLVAGYDEVAPLAPAELEVLYDLMRTRLAMSVCMAARQHAGDPSNDYLLVSQEGVRDVLRRLAGVSPDLAHFLFRDAVGFAADPSSRLVRQYFASGGARPTPVLDRFEVATGRHGEGRRTCRAPLPEGAGGAEETVHLGRDLAAEKGSVVRCPLPGVVRTVLPGPGGEADGLVIVEHHMIADQEAGVRPTGADRRFWTLYRHLEPGPIKPGEVLAPGAPLGTAGSFLHLQLVTHLLGLGAGFPGAVPEGEADVWTNLSPDPNLLLPTPQGGAARPRRSAAGIAARRRTNMSGAMSLSYREPLHIVRGEGAYLIDGSGRRWLDMVNNVCHVGHCHPRVVEAGRRQMGVLNTNTRYLHESVVDLARRLVELLPDPLKVCFFVNSGSEANDLALRLATAHTGASDRLVVDHAYHGHLSSLVALSPYKFDGRGGHGRPDTTHVCELPDPYRGRLRAGRDAGLGIRYAESVAGHLAGLRAAGRRPAAFFAESLQSCGGQIVYPDGYLRAAFEHVRKAGGVCVADEVQVGFGRVGRHFWGFELQGVVPDIVTMGKPMGNGHPLAAVVTTPEVARSFVTGMEWFNTYGGNPVSAEIGLAVLDVIRDEHLQARARARGERLLAGLNALRKRHPLIGDVRGEGLFLGVELSLPGRSPATAQAGAVKEAAKARGVLLSTDGPDDNVLKIKPPLVLAEEDCDLFLEVLDEALGEVERVV